MLLFRSKPKASSIRTRIESVIDRKIEEAEQKHELACDQAREQYDQDMNTAAKRYNDAIIDSEDASVKEVLQMFAGK